MKQELDSLHQLTICLTILIVNIIIMSGCASKTERGRDVVAELSGSEITIPEVMACQVAGKPVDYDLYDADFKIVTFIDSDGCTPCKMKLEDWDEVINEFKGFDDVEVNFLMIISASGDSKTKASETIEKYDFRHPVSFDIAGNFATDNRLPDESRYHTFLLNEQNEIVAIGNPAVNPKVRQLYRKAILSDIEDNDISEPKLCNRTTYAVGVINPGDTVRRDFRLVNNSGSVYTIQAVVPSCDCTTATHSPDTISQGMSTLVNVQYVADTVPGPFRRYVDVYLNEKENPERLTLHGFISNNN